MGIGDAGISGDIGATKRKSQKKSHFCIKMFNASNLIVRAMNSFPEGKSRKNKKQFLGKKHRFYLNDRGFYRDEYLKSAHWQALRRAKLEKNPQCQVCGTQYNLDVHHKEYKFLYNVKIEDLITLCRKHHILKHKKLKKRKTEILSKKREKEKRRSIKKEKLEVVHFCEECLSTKNLYPRRVTWDRSRSIEITDYKMLCSKCNIKRISYFVDKNEKRPHYYHKSNVSVFQTEKVGAVPT